MPTIGSGKDFATIAAYAADIDGDSLGANTVGLCTGTITDTTQIHFQNVTLNGFTVSVRPDTGQGFGDNANKLTNALRYNTANGTASVSTFAGMTWDIDINMSLIGMQISKDGNYGGFINGFGGAVTVTDCILKVAAANSVGGQFTNFGAGSLLTNVLLYKTGSSGSAQALAQLSAGAAAVNSVFANTGSGTAPSVGVASAYGTAPVTNCVSFGCTTDASGTFSGSNNATNAAAGGFPATGRQNSMVGATEWVSVTDGSEDFRLAGTSAKLKDLGTSSGAPSTDIVGQSRSGSYDIGVWEVQGGGGGSIVPILNHMQRMRTR